MTCLVPARGGEQIETQNVVGTRELDLLAASDFMFPRGFDHHRLFAGITGLTNVVQAFARRVAGLGKIPDEALLPRTARHSDVDVLIVGAGACGLAFADTLLSEAPGVTITIVDERAAPGGHWIDAYDFVKTHQPASFYGVNSTQLGHDRIDESGLNAGFYDLASGAEIRLGGIAWSETAPLAYLNGKLLRIGESATGARVERIERDRVVLAAPEGRIVITLR